MKYIVGVGNYSMYDDSIGIRIVEYIYENKLDTNFTAIDLSSNSLNLLTYFTKDTQQILLIDSIKHNIEPGKFIFMEPKDIVSTKQLDGFSTHEGDILKVIELAKSTNYYIPPISIMGIQAKTIINEFGLSDILKNNLQTYVNEAIRFINA